MSTIKELEDKILSLQKRVNELKASEEVKLKAGQVWHNLDTGHKYVIVDDYGTLRPVMLENLNINSSFNYGRYADSKETGPLYNGDTLVNESLHAYYADFFMLPMVKLNDAGSIAVNESGAI